MLSKSSGIWSCQSNTILSSMGTLATLGWEMLTARLSHQAQNLGCPQKTRMCVRTHMHTHTVADQLSENMESLGLILCWNPIQIAL